MPLGLESKCSLAGRQAPRLTRSVAAAAAPHSARTSCHGASTSAPSGVLCCMSTSSLLQHRLCHNWGSNHPLQPGHSSRSRLQPQAVLSAAQDSDATTSTTSSGSTSIASSRASMQAPSVCIRPVAQPAELQQVAKLRAEAYYEDDRSRFAESFKRQFAAQEVESLKQRTVARNGRAPLSECLVAVNDAGAVVGCIDIRLPEAATGVRTTGVPLGEQHGCYILNVVVKEAQRGQGIGRELMKAAMRQAVHQWGAKGLYTHVEADNEVAYALYKGQGFDDHSDETRYDNQLALGRLVLLRADVSKVPAE